MTKENKNLESNKDLGIKRVFDKILDAFAKSSIMPGKYRALFQKWRGVKFENVKSVFFGENVTIDGIHPENVYIGKGCIITKGSKILTHFIDTDRLSDSPVHYFRFYQGKVIIQENVFIGFNAVIAKPITIGSGSIIGANSVVTKNVEPNSVMVGSPAKCIRKLDRKVFED